MTSQKRRIYQNYLDKWHTQHPDVVQPEVFGGMEPRPLSEAPSVQGLKPFGYQSKRNQYGHPLGNFELADGRVVEVFTTTSGGMNMAAVFPSKAAFYSYAEPVGEHAFFEEW